jgi:hypothetical protein
MAIAIRCRAGLLDCCPTSSDSNPIFVVISCALQRCMHHRASMRRRGLERGAGNALRGHLLWLHAPTSSLTGSDRASCSETANWWYSRLDLTEGGKNKVDAGRGSESALIRPRFGDQGWCRQTHSPAAVSSLLVGMHGSIARRSSWSHAS